MATTFDNVIIGWAFELVGLGLVAMIAESSDDAGNVVILVMVGLWLVFLIMRPDMTRAINNIVGYGAKAATGRA